MPWPWQTDVQTVLKLLPAAERRHVLAALEPGTSHPGATQDTAHAPQLRAAASASWPCTWLMAYQA